MADTCVRVHRRSRQPYDPAQLAAWVGIDDPPAATRQQSPALWIGNRLHHEATAWLEYRHSLGVTVPSLKGNDPCVEAVVYERDKDGSYRYGRVTFYGVQPCLN